MVKKLAYFCFLVLCWQPTMAGTTETETGTDVDVTTEENAEETAVLAAEDEESLECAIEVIKELTEGKLPEELDAMAGIIASALKEKCKCDANAVNAMIEAGVSFDVAFNSITEKCELEGTEVGELARALSPGVGGTAGGGPGGGVSPE